MMPLTLAQIETVNTIKKIGGNEETRHHLQNLGFVPGAKIVVLYKVNDNLVVNIKETRVALNADLAKKIMI